MQKHLNIKYEPPDDSLLSGRFYVTVLFERSLKMVKKFILLAMTTICIVPNVSHALRCGSDLVDVGDLKQEVLVKCGTPYSKEEIGYIDQETNGSRITVMKVEEWIILVSNEYYSLVFEGNKLVKIESAGKK